MIKIGVLVDNRISPQRDCMLPEHGLSIYFEANGRTWLYDVGASDAFLKNAKVLGVDIDEIDTLILSHGHNDHTGGLSSFLEKNKNAEIVAQETIDKKDYFSLSHDPMKNISIDHSLLKDIGDRVCYVKDSKWLSENVVVVRNTVFDYPQPKANSELLAGSDDVFSADKFGHEIAVVICTKNGLVILSACSHNGVLNIIESCKKATNEERVLAFIGGAHIKDKHFDCENESKEIAEILLKKYPETKIVLGHCTGNKALKIMSSILGDNFISLYSGWSCSFPK